METPADWANSATSSGGTTLELSGPFENTTTTFRPLFSAASFSVNKSEVGLAASGGSHTIKNRGGHRFQFCRLGADHVDRNSGRLGKFSDVLRWYYAEFAQ